MQTQQQALQERERELKRQRDELKAEEVKLALDAKKFTLESNKAKNPQKLATIFPEFNNSTKTRDLEVSERDYQQFTRWVEAKLITAEVDKDNQPKAGFIVRFKVQDTKAKTPSEEKFDDLSDDDEEVDAVVWHLGMQRSPDIEERIADVMEKLRARLNTK
jgi:hypothetical protein